MASPFQIEGIDELKDGDNLIVTGIFNSNLMLQDEEDGKSKPLDNEATESKSDPISAMMELNSTLFKLTNQLARLITRLDKQEASNSNIQVESLIKQLAKSTELSNKQFNEIMGILSQHGSPNLFSPDEKRKSIAPPRNADNALVLHGTLEISKVATFVDHTGPLWVLEITSDILISGSSDKTIKLWDLTSMKLVKTLEGHTGIVHCLAVHKGKLISGSDDKSIRVLLLF